MTSPRAAQDSLSVAAWRLTESLLDNPQAAAGQPAATSQTALLPTFGGDEDLLNAAVDELLVVPIQLGEDDQPWSAFHVLAAARFEPRDDDVLVYYRFHPDFLRLLKIARRRGSHQGPIRLASRDSASDH